MCRTSDTSTHQQPVGSNHLISPRLVIALLVLAVSTLFMTAVHADQPLSVGPYVVQSGDTLWGIAATLTEAGEDIRVMVSTVREINDLTSSTIQPGQVLLLPSGQ